MPRLKEVVRGSVEMLCVGRYSASEPQNLEAKVGVRAEPPVMVTALHRLRYHHSQGRVGPAGSWSAAVVF